jgi:hypothetical protein
MAPVLSKTDKDAAKKAKKAARAEHKATVESDDAAGLAPAGVIKAGTANGFAALNGDAAPEADAAAAKKAKKVGLDKHFVCITSPI